MATSLMLDAIFKGITTKGLVQRFLKYNNVPVALNNPKEANLMKFKVETEQEQDGRWIAEIIELPGVIKYGKSREEAIAQVEALALRVMADRIEHGEHPVEPVE